MKKHMTKILALALALAVAIGAIALASDGGILSSAQIDQIVETTTDASQVTSPFIYACSVVCQSVVGVNNYQLTTTRNYNNSNGYGYGYGYGYGFGYGNGYGWGGNDYTQTEKLAGTASGVVVSEYGHILTNYHVVEDASRVTITIPGEEKELEAEVVATDEEKDLAVLHVDNLGLPAVQLGDSDQLQVGEWAIVIGNPLGDEFARTVTVGVVSALDREVSSTTYDKYGRKTSITNTEIQVDAAINAGNSGGGMFNTLGQLMGVPNSKYVSSSSETDVDNIGMCVPINVAKPLIRQALESYTGDKEPAAETEKDAETASSDRPMLGVTVSTLSSTWRQYMNLPQGAVVTAVTENSNAARAGIQKGDIIVEINGTAITSSSELVSAVQAANEGDTLNIKVYRAEGLADMLDSASSDYIRVGEGEYIDLTATLLMNTSM